MKQLLVLWDPKNPLSPVGSVVSALEATSDLEVKTLTFGEVSHQTMPNRAFELRPKLGRDIPDAILWVEGGPLPSDLDRFDCPKACWLLNTHLEPTLLSDVGPQFDVVFSASLRDTAEEKARWLPLAAESGDPVSAPGGLSLLIDDPMPPSHASVEQDLLASAPELGATQTPVVLCLGSGGQLHPMFFESLRSGATLVVDPGSDLRGVACPNDHLEVFPSTDQLVGFLKEVLRDPDRLALRAQRGKAIVDHLHQPRMRAASICDGIWPRHRVLSGQAHRSRVSILVTCYKYLRRLRFCLDSLRRQKMPPGSLEIVVADPGSPDGLANYLEVFAREDPALRVVHLPLDPVYHRNRGVAINRAFDASSGQVAIGIDGDLVFHPEFAGLLERCVLQNPDRVFGIRRSFVSKEDTGRILSGDLDPFADFERLSQSEGDGEENSHVGVLGYCQAVHRKAFARARYPEEFDMVNQSDIVFVERLKKECGMVPHFLEDHVALHLWHPRNWSGTTELL